MCGAGSLPRADRPYCQRGDEWLLMAQVFSTFFTIGSAVGFAILLFLGVPLTLLVKLLWRGR